MSTESIPAADSSCRPADSRSVTPSTTSSSESTQRSRSSLIGASAEPKPTSVTRMSSDQRLVTSSTAAAATTLRARSRSPATQIAPPALSRSTKIRPCPSPPSDTSPGSGAATPSTAGSGVERSSTQRDAAVLGHERRRGLVLRHGEQQLERIGGQPGRVHLGDRPVVLGQRAGERAQGAVEVVGARRVRAQPDRDLGRGGLGVRQRRRAAGACAGRPGGGAARRAPRARRRRAARRRPGPTAPRATAPGRAPARRSPARRRRPAPAARRPSPAPATPHSPPRTPSPSPAPTRSRSPQPGSGGRVRAEGRPGARGRAGQRTRPGAAVGGERRRRCRHVGTHLDEPLARASAGMISVQPGRIRLSSVSFDPSGCSRPLLSSNTSR